MTPKKDQVAMKKKNFLNTFGQSSNRSEIIDTTPIDCLNSVSPTCIKSKFTPFTIFPAMITNKAAIKEQLAQIVQAITNLQKIVEDKDFQIAQLMRKYYLTNVEELTNNNKHASFSNNVGNKKQVDKTPPMYEFVHNYTHSQMSVATLSAQQLQEMIANIMKAQYARTTQSSPAYSKFYTKLIDSLKMSIGDQMPKLQQLDENATQENISPTSSRHATTLTLIVTSW
ncbi:UNVERIFIED_CONTAM: hypothetical protein Sradi_4918600 [Sesamum radiatum]|uniref:Ty3-gypsy retrotransposon protein n=1 Tax=Sesamum radiatum TaxID=300843 RepID=A0AAW2MEM9_SESRA